MKVINVVKINEDKIYLRKSFDGWRVVHPYKDEDGKMIWFNLLTGGSYYRLMWLLIYVLIILFVIFEVSKNYQLANSLIVNYTCNKLNVSSSLNVSNLNLLIP